MVLCLRMQFQGLASELGRDIESTRMGREPGTLSESIKEVKLL